MTYIERHIIQLTSDSSGDAVGYTPVINGKISNVIYDKDDFEDTVDITVTLEATGQNIWTESNVTASKTKAPRQLIHDEDGNGLATVPGGGSMVNHINAAEDRVKVLIAQAGDTKSGTFTIVME